MDDPALAPQLAAVRSLTRYAAAEVTPNLKSTGDPYDTLVVAALFARATSTTDSVVLLAEHGFGQQAMMLNRSLHEHMVDAHWAHANRDLARKRFLQHAQFQWHLRRETATRYPSVFGDLVPAEPIPPDKLNELIKLFGKHGVKSWTGLNMYERVKAIEPLFPDERDRLWQIHHIVHETNNGELHPSSWSLARAARRVKHPSGREMVQLRTGPEPELAPVALGNAWWSYGHILALVHDTFALQLEPLHKLAEQGIPLFLDDAYTSTVGQHTTSGS